MGEKEILRYLFLVDRRLDIISSSINWKPEYEVELESIDSELAGLREVVDAEHVKRNRQHEADRKGDDVRGKQEAVYAGFLS